MNREAASTPAIKAGGDQMRLGGLSDKHWLRRAWLAWVAGALSLTLTVLALGLLALSYRTPVPLDWGFRGWAAIMAVAYSTVGAIVASRRPDNRVGWLFCAAGLIAGALAFLSEYAIVALLARPGALPGGLVAAWVAAWIWVPFVGLISTFLPLLFPTGRLLSPRWRPVGWLSAGAFALLSLYMAFRPGPLQNLTFATNPIGLEGASGVMKLVGGISSLLTLGSAIASGLAVIVRFRRSSGEERQQLKWFAYAAALLVAFAPLGIALVATLLPIATQVGIPVATGIAILKYRLYDIDIIIRRSLVYGVLTAALVVIYFGSVVLLHELFGRLISERNDLAIIVSTLAIAALFNPLRRRIQDFIDRRFYRRKYDAEQVLATFGATLREEVDLARLSDTLLRVVEETMRPAHVSLWLREVPVQAQERRGEERRE